MRWGEWLIMTGVVLLIFLVEWPRFRSYTRKEKLAFCSLLCIGWILSLFDLTQTPGPITFVEALFKPLGAMLER